MSHSSIITCFYPAYYPHLRGSEIYFDATTIPSTKGVAPMVTLRYQ